MSQKDKLKFIDIEFIKDKYYIEKLSMLQLAKLLNVTNPGLRKYFKRNNLALRTNSDVRKNSTLVQAHLKKIRPLLIQVNTGRTFKHTEETKRKLSISHTKPITLEDIKGKSVTQRVIWRKFKNRIMLRHNYICTICSGKATQAHHIKPREDYPELCWEEGNILPVCKSCHLQLHTVMNLGNKLGIDFQEQIIEYLDEIKEAVINYE